MITAKDAISTAMDLLGTPYSDLDCINFIKKIIRTAPGGDPKYTDAHVPALWASYDSSPKYRHLSARWTNIDNLKPGRLVFKGKPLGRDHEPSHVGMYIGNGQVIHSSSAKGCVVITDVGNGQWTLSGDSVMIQVGEDEGGGGGTDPILYQARVITQRDSLRMRTGPGTSYPVIGSVPKGAIVGVLAEPDPEWDYISYQGRTGYASAQYLERVDPEPQPGPQLDPDSSCPYRVSPVPDYEISITLTTLMDDEGHFVTLLGRWRVVED